MGCSLRHESGLSVCVVVVDRNLLDLARGELQGKELGCELLRWDNST
jgi:hypothetical protein